MFTSTDKGSMFHPGQAKKEVKLVPGTGNSLASIESLSMPLVHEVVLSANIQCEECQRRIADIMSRMNETDSVLVNVLEKKVTLSCRYPGNAKLPFSQVPVVYKDPVSTMGMMKRIFRSFRR